MAKITLKELQSDLRKIKKITKEMDQIYNQLEDKRSILYGEQIGYGFVSSAICISVARAVTVNEIKINEEYDNYYKRFEPKQKELQTEMEIIQKKYESLMNDYSGIIDSDDRCYDDEENLINFIKNLTYLMEKGLKP